MAQSEAGRTPVAHGTLILGLTRHVLLPKEKGHEKLAFLFWALIFIIDKYKKTYYVCLNVRRNCAQRKTQIIALRRDNESIFHYENKEGTRRHAGKACKRALVKNRKEDAQKVKVSRQWSSWAKEDQESCLSHSSQVRLPQAHFRQALGCSILLLFLGFLSSSPPHFPPLHV